MIEKVPHGHWKTTLIAALGISDIRCSTVVDGAVNSDMFQAFVEHVLVHELKPGDCCTTVLRVDSFVVFGRTCDLDDRFPHCLDMFAMDSTNSKVSSPAIPLTAQDSAPR